MKAIVGLFFINYINTTFGFHVAKNYAPNVHTSRVLASRRADAIREQLTAPKQTVIDAVAKQKDKRMTVSDMAALSGEDLQESQRGLMALASLTGADLEVTQEGELVYNFPDNFMSVLQQRSMLQKMRRARDVAAPVLFYMVRVSFGLALMSSLAILSSLLVVVTSSSTSPDNNNNNNENRGRYNKRGVSGGITVPMDLVWRVMVDVLYYRDSYGYYNTLAEASATGRVPPPQLTFYETFFSYVFGDGDPNANLVEKQTSFMATLIRKKGGVVVAEDLAPYLDPPDISGLGLEDGRETSLTTPSVIVDESWVLPAVLRLGGEPTVTGDGDIVYSFPELCTTAQATSASPLIATDPEPERALSARLVDRVRGKPHQDSILPASIKEEEVPFSIARDEQKMVAAALGGANLIGCLWLTRLLGQVQFAVLNPELWAALSRLQPWLLGYALLYNAVPVARMLLIGRRNAQIRERNEKRQQWLSYLLSPDRSLTRKIDASRVIVAAKGLRTRQIGTGDVLFSTKEEDINEGALNQFDQKLRDAVNDELNDTK